MTGPDRRRPRGRILTDTGRDWLTGLAILLGCAALLILTHA